MWNGSRPAVGDVDHVGAGRLGAHAGALDITCGSALVNSTTSPASSGTASPPTRLAKQRPCGHDMIGDQMVGARQDARQDQFPRRRSTDQGACAAISK